MRVLTALGLGMIVIPLVAAIAVAASVGSGAETVPVALDAASGEVAPVKVTPEEALDKDAGSYAAQFGVSPAQARERLGKQEALDEALAQLEERFPDRFAGGWIQHAPGFRAVARFKGKVPQEAQELAGSDVQLRGGAAESLAELEARAGRVHDDVSARLGLDMVTSYDVETGLVEVSLATPAGTEGVSDAELRGQLPETARTAAVRVDLVDGPVAEDHGIYAGAKTISNTDTCTTGFTVFDIDTGEEGFLTAGHCANDRDYQEPDGTVYDADYVAGHRGDWGDYQWHTTDEDEVAEFYDSSSDRRDVHGYVGSISKGDFFCEYGRFGGYNCSTVHRTDVRYTVDGYTYDRIVAMKDNIGVSGDSGGPYFINNNAVGVLKGYTTIGLKKRGTFSRITYIDNALDIGLLVK